MTPNSTSEAGLAGARQSTSRSRSGFSLSANREGGACGADQIGGDGKSDACNRKPFTFRKFQIGVPYRIDETQPCDDCAGKRDPKCSTFVNGEDNRIPKACPPSVLRWWQQSSGDRVGV
jgi:hypothetical protein